MKNKSSLMLIEQVIMGLVFAIAAAICLKVFAYSDVLSRNGDLRDQAIRQAQTCAEVLKNTRGDFAAAEAAADRSKELNVSISPEASENGLLGSATISVEGANGEELYSLRVCWQEG